jgi:hypothetical protein
MTEHSDRDGAGIWRDPGGTLALDGHDGGSYHRLEDDHQFCVVWCRSPRMRFRRHHTRCPSCYGRTAVRDILGTDLDPEISRWAWRLGSFLAGWHNTALECTVGMVRRPAPGNVVCVQVDVICKGDAFL